MKIRSKRNLYNVGNRIVLREDIKINSFCGGIDCTKDHIDNKGKDLKVKEVQESSRGYLYYITEELGEKVKITDVMVDQIKSKKTIRSES